MPSERNERAEKILRVATTLFHERGFGGVGVDQIGEGAGMSGPAIYRYFSGKDEILSILIDEAIDRILMSVGGRYSDPAEELDHLIRGHARRAIDEPELVSLWLRERSALPKEYRTRLNARIGRYVDRWVDCLSTCYPGHPREVVLAAVHATQGLIDSTAFWPAKSRGVAGLEDLLCGMATAGLEWLGEAP